MTFKPFILRLSIFIILLYAIIPFTIKFIGTSPQISINVLYVPVFFAALLLAFIILKRNELKTFNYAFSPKQLLFIVLSYCFFIIYILQQQQYWNIDLVAYHLITGWILYSLGGLFLFIGVFNTNFVKKFIRPIFGSIFITVIYVGFSVLLNLASYPLSSVLAQISGKLLSFTNMVVVESNFIRVDSFSAVIGPPCTGVTSLILYTGLFLFVVLLDWNKMNLRSLLWIYPLGALGMFLVAFLRLYLLFFIGANYSSDFALKGFHSNAGWILFVVYFFIYFWLTYPKMVKSSDKTFKYSICK